MGPSVFTMPHYVDELFVQSGKNPRDHFNYIKLDLVYRYFLKTVPCWMPGMGRKSLLKRPAARTNEKKEDIIRYLQKTKTVYDLTEEVFLQNSLHKLKNFLPGPYFVVS